MIVGFTVPVSRRQKSIPSVWSDPKELEDEISMPTRDGPRLRKNSFSQGIEQGTVSFSDEDFAGLKRFMEKRDRDAAHGTVSLIDTWYSTVP